MKQIFIVIFLFICIGKILGSPDDSLSNKIEILEQKVAIQDSLLNKIKILEQKIAFQDTLLNKINAVKNISGILTNPIALISKLLETCFWFGIILGFVYGLIWFLNKLKLFKEDWHLNFIKNLVEKYEEVNVLKKNKRILLLSHPEANNEKFLNGLLKEFKIVERLKVSDKFVQPKETYDIVFANYERGGQNQVILLEYIKGVHDCLFYFGQTSSWDFKTEEYALSNKRVNLANARAQIYANLISTLKFHNLTSPDVEN